MANLGGMQRVANELHQALSVHPSVQLTSVVLRSHARWTPLRTPFFYPRVYWSIRRLAQRKKIDAVLFSSLVTGILATVLQRKLRKLGIRMLAIVHGDDVIAAVKPYQAMLPRVFSALDAVLPVSRASGQACLNRGAKEASVFVIPNGIDPMRFSAKQPKDVTRRGIQDLLGLPSVSPDALLLFSVGRHVKRKGFAWFVDRVMSMLPDNVHYWLAGQGPETETIRRAIARNRLDQRVRLLGRVSDKQLELHYRCADLFIMPNVRVNGTMEGFGVVMLEAGQCGLPTIGARLEGIEDVITEGENGHLVEDANARQFADTIDYFNRHRTALTRLSQRTIPYAKRFAWESIVNRMLQVIRMIG